MTVSNSDLTASWPLLHLLQLLTLIKPSVICLISTPLLPPVWSLTTLSPGDVLLLVLSFLRPSVRGTERRGNGSNLAWQKTNTFSILPTVMSMPLSSQQKLLTTMLTFVDARLPSSNITSQTLSLVKRIPDHFRPPPILHVSHRPFRISLPVKQIQSVAISILILLLSILVMIHMFRSVKYNFSSCL